ncbi:unnamed protein product, partial [Ectocarpus sp. 13 AM-2016]
LHGNDAHPGRLRRRRSKAPTGHGGRCRSVHSHGGTASNLVTLIANGDVALSVSMTTVSTLLAAVITGPLTKFLVGALVDISAVTLMKATAQVVFLPGAMGLLLNTRAKGITRRLAPYTPLLCVALVAMICGSVVAANSSILLGSGAALVGAVLTLHAGG